MRQAIASSHGKSTVEHACEEDQRVARIACIVLPLLPHEGVGCVAFSVVKRHDSADKNCDKDTAQHEE